MSKVQIPARCSFCNREHADVKKLIAAGNTDVAICDQCVEVCNDIIADKARRPSSDENEANGEPSELLPFKCPACGHAWKMARK